MKKKPITLSQIKRRYTSLEKRDNGWAVYLQIDQQSFLIREGLAKYHVLWTQRQLATAIHRLIENESKP